MFASQLRTAAELCKVLGVKSMIYGGPGTGKTPLALTAPNPVLCAAEPGLLSIRNSNIPVWEAFQSFPKVKEFVTWAIGSHEARQFHTFIFDSVSQIAEDKLELELRGKKDGRAAYGAMAREVMELMNQLYYAPYMHIVLIAKQANIEVDGQMRYRPYFPGQDLHIKVPHLFDVIMRVSYKQGQDGKQYRVFDTQDSFNFVARDRIGKLAPVEPADITHIINKSMS